MKLIVNNSGNRLDKYLVEKISGISRAKIQNAIRAGVVKINGRPVEKSSFRLKSGDIISLEEKALEVKKNNPLPENIPLEIIYEDEDIVIVNKPAGLITHPTPKVSGHTLVNALLYRYPEMAEVGDNPARPGILHRLDQNTSGLIIAAKNNRAFEFIKKQFLAREVKKIYLAIVEGVPRKSYGEINYDIRPSTINRLKKVAVKKISEAKDKSHRSAKTLYEVKEKFNNNFALLEVRPLSGRTHQIRVHLSAIGHPIVGDELYGSRSGRASRQMLHAGQLLFISTSGKKIDVSVNPPKDFQNVLSKIKNPQTHKE